VNGVIYTSNPAGEDAGMYEFYFEEERDYTAFVVWKQ
jgi:hypothetical protein